MRDERLLFSKIKYWCNMALDIAAFGENQGIPHLVERMEMTCGAVPDGEFEQVIDPEAAQQFLELYEHVAEYRIAFAVTELLKLNDGYMNALRNYFAGQGKSQGALYLAAEGEGDGSAEKHDASAMEALDLMQTYVLSGLDWETCNKVISQTEDQVVWETICDPHESWWKKSGGNVDLYYEFEWCFVDALVDGLGFLFERKEDGKFYLRRKA